MARLTDSVELALKIGEGRLLVDPGEGGEPIWMSERFACIECGICSYICPSHLPLLLGIRILKRAARE